MKKERGPLHPAMVPEQENHKTQKGSIVKVKYLIALGAITACTNLAAETYSNKTYLTTHPVINNLALEYATWNPSISKTAVTKHGGTLQVSGMYQHTTDRSQMGKYFGYWATNAKEYRDYIQVDNYAGNFQQTNDAIWSEYIVRDQNAPATNLSDKIQFRPNQEVFSARFDYHHNLDKVANGLFFEFSLPVMKIKNTMNPTRIGTTFTSIKIVQAGIAHQSTGKTLFDFLSGDVYEITTEENLQDPLKAAKIVNSQSRSGIADLSAKLGFNLINKETRRAGISALVTMPTGNRPTGEYIFEPLCGNCHWGLGGALDANFQLWTNKATTVSFATNITTQYFVEEIEKRTLGIKRDDGTSVPFGQYYAIGQRRLAKVFPFANVSNQELKVTPGLVSEGLFSMIAAFKKLNIALGYNIFLKQKERVTLNQAWANNTYAIASTAYSGTTIFGTNPNHLDQNIMNARQTIDDKNIDLNAVATPTQISHKVVASLSYLSRDHNPLLFGVGGSYEIGQNNAAPSSYALWVQASCAF